VFILFYILALNKYISFICNTPLSTQNISKMAVTGQCFAVPRRFGLAKQMEPNSLCVDTYKDAIGPMVRYKHMNPFYYSKENNIPVPGQLSMNASSVESIWQGLKIINGRTDFEMFNREPYKRPLDSERGQPQFRYSETIFCYGSNVLDIVTARWIIYLPSYLYILENIVPDSLLEYITDHINNGYKIYFYDWDSNMDITDASSSFSHSAILASYFQGQLKKRFLEPLESILADFQKKENLPNLFSYNFKRLNSYDNKGY
jgi:hypothetical protein